MFEVGSSAGGWRVESLIHQGSMAVSYAVTQPPDHQRYAMKVLFMHDTSFQERLRRAGAVLLSVRHPNLLPIVEVADVEGLVTVISPFVEGGNLTQWLAQDARSIAEVVQVFRRVCQGLRVAHEHGLVHRNLKPQKILVDLTGRPYIHDFMLGKVVGTDPEQAVTQMGTTFGTPQYMAPEQFRGAAGVDQRADIFSLGCVLYEMVAGRRAFDGKGLMEIYKQVTTEDRPRLVELCPECPPALEALVDDLLRPDPERRPPSVREVVTRIDGQAELRALVNPSFRTATPVSALTSSRSEPIERRAPLSHPPDAVTDPGDERSNKVPARRKHATPLSVDSRPSLPTLITFTDGDSAESTPGPLPPVPVAKRLDAEPEPPASPLGWMLWLFPVLFLVAAAVGAAIASR